MIKKIVALAILGFTALPAVFCKTNRFKTVEMQPASAFYTDPVTLRQSLLALQNKVPLTYNNSVQNAINNYSSFAQKGRFSRVLGLSKYYFPIYEKVFKESNVPEELKYISVIESSLNPHAVSKAGATGPWQFLYEVGKIYGLSVNDSIDERKDPFLAAKAAARYLSDSYAMYGDWLLAIASYNCGRNNIKWAMEDAGSGPKDYWSLRRFLPAETQDYVPAFIATLYVMNNCNKLGILPVTAHFRTDTESLPVDRSISIPEIAERSKLSLGELSVLNPAYSKLVINGKPEAPKKIIIPQPLPTFSYNAICSMLGLPLRVDPLPPPPPAAAAPKPKVLYHISYKVQSGDTYDSIAEKFAVPVDLVKAANNKVAELDLKAELLLRIPQIK